MSKLGLAYAFDRFLVVAQNGSETVFAISDMENYGCTNGETFFKDATGGDVLGFGSSSKMKKGDLYLAIDNKYSSYSTVLQTSTGTVALDSNVLKSDLLISYTFPPSARSFKLVYKPHLYLPAEFSGATVRLINHTSIWYIVSEIITLEVLHQDKPVMYAALAVPLYYMTTVPTTLTGDRKSVV